jgi:hypothetical protein
MRNGFERNDWTAVSSADARTMFMNESEGRLVILVAQVTID